MTAATATGINEMAGEVHELSARIGALEATVTMLGKIVSENQETTTAEHRKVHDIVVATAEAVRNLTRIIGEMKPLTDDYREKRAEKRGVARLGQVVLVTFGGISGAVCARLIEFLSFKLH